MDPNYWLKKWDKNEIAFHGSKANPLLVKHFAKLEVPKGSRVFLPLCGKTLDAAWLLTNGYRVVGAELAETAIEQLFRELGIAPQITPLGNLKRYSAENIDILVGDFFAVTADVLGPVDAVYDRAARVALPAELRGKYASHLAQASKKAPQLLITYEYDQSKTAGPPFSIPREELERDSKQTGYHLHRIENVSVQGGLRGECPADEVVWTLRSV